MMNTEEFLIRLQEKIAIGAVGASALRNQGAAGVVKSVRDYLISIDLSSIPTNKMSQFQHWLDTQTKEILNRMPIEVKTKNLPSGPWGAARKALNLFLRDVFYNRYLFKNYYLKKIEEWLELPLDSVVANELRKKDKTSKLPRWTGLKYLLKEDSEKYQKFAVKLANEKNIARVHLDLTLWTENR